MKILGGVLISSVLHWMEREVQTAHADIPGWANRTWMIPDMGFELLQCCWSMDPQGEEPLSLVQLRSAEPSTLVRPPVVLNWLIMQVFTCSSLVAEVVGPRSCCFLLGHPSYHKLF